MHMTIEIVMDNAAFADTPGTEVAALLRKLATEFDGGVFVRDGRIRNLTDHNGNFCGRVDVGL